MPIGIRRSRWRFAIASALIAAALVPVDPAAAADPAAPARTTPADPAPQGVSPLPTTVVQPPRPTGDRPRLALRPKDRKQSTIDMASSCWPYAYVSSFGNSYDEFLEETVGVSYSGGVDCDFSLDYISGEIGGVDRSPAFNGDVFSGLWLGSSGIWGYGPSAGGFGGFGVRARYYNGARYVEPVLSLTLVAPAGMVWDYCGYVLGLVYYACDGLGTSTLYLLLGGVIQGTGLTPACRDQSVQGDWEQARIFRPNGPAPFATQILGSIPSIRNRVISFKQALCYTSAGQAGGFAAAQGQQLWDTAVSEARNPATQNDDRPLYWARLSMTTALAQWVTVAPATRPALQNSLDRAARGMNSHNFDLGTVKKVVVSGFDPFDLDGSGIVRGNPSAAAVLGLDHTTLNGAEVQVVIFPVRYQDFNAGPGLNGIVEAAFAPHLTPGPQQATLITTVSQGDPESWDFECWNGSSRSADPYPDNRNQLSGGTQNNPRTPGYPYTTGKPFARSTLPVQPMRASAPFLSFIDRTLSEIPFPGAQPVPRGSRSQTGDCQPPIPSTVGWIPVEGSGGGFLSNEVAYRVTELRDQLGSEFVVKAGHIHTPMMDRGRFPNPPDPQPDPARRNQIVSEYRQILAAGIASM